jgi:hypothetical protein
MAAQLDGKTRRIFSVDRDIDRGHRGHCITRWLTVRLPWSPVRFPRG